jgi:parallel beta-helix repeat protein
MKNQSINQKVSLMWVVAIVLFSGLFTACKKGSVADGSLINSGSPKENVASVSSVSYYVATTGNDTNAGTLAAPFRTIQKGLNVATAAGTTVYVRAGTYNERLVWTNSGALNDDIVLSNYNSEVVYLDGSTASAQDAMIIVSSKSNITIKGINIRNNYRAFAKGIHVFGSGSGISIENCKIFNIGWSTSKTAIPTSSDQANPLVVVGSGSTSYSDIYVFGTEIYDCVTGYSESLTLTGNVDQFLIDNNNIHDNTNIGIDVAGHYAWTGAPAALNQARNGTISDNKVTNCVSQVATSAGIYSDGAHNVTIERNTLTGNGCGISLGCENASKISSDIMVIDNFVYNNRTAGIVIGSGTSNSKVQNCDITNNTFYKNYSVGGYGGEIHYQNADDIVVKSNIIQSRSDVAIIALLGYTATNLVMDYNMYYTLSGSSGTITFDWGGINGTGYFSLANFKAGTGKDTNSNYYNPLFVNGSLPNPDLHLSGTSPAINSGQPGYILSPGELDIDGGTRILNSRVDKGADEITSTRAPTL